MTQKTAVVFPGQGSQSLGMLSDVVARFPEMKDTFHRASSVLGYDVWALIQEGPVEKLNQTAYTQPALLAASYAVWEVLQKNHAISPDYLAGHSLGEYTALVVAGALKFEEALGLVAARGQFMQEAVLEGEGAMAAIIGLDDVAVATICEIAIHSPDEVLTPANFNSIGQVVIAGHRAPVLRAIEIAKEKGASMTVLIPVSVPSHCALMKKAATRLAEKLKEITLNVPSIPVINNADVNLYSSVDDIRAGLMKQLYMPVRWVETIQWFVGKGVDRIVECGPGKVLTGLNKRIHKPLQLMTTSSLDTISVLINQ